MLSIYIDIGIVSIRCCTLSLCIVSIYIESYVLKLLFYFLNQMIFFFSILLRSTLFDIVSLNLRRPVPIKNPLIGMKKNSLLVSLA